MRDGESDSLSPPPQAEEEKGTLHTAQYKNALVTSFRP